MSRVRLIVLVLAWTAGVVWVSSCGDGAVEPTPAPAAPVATTVTVNPGSAALSALGETARFTAEVRDQNGQVMAGAAVAWTSSDASVATVDASGVVTAAANGSATITATAGSVAGTAAVTVAQMVSAVAVSPAADTLVAFGDTVRLVAEATDANGHAVATVTEFEWSSSDTLVARVDDTGLVESLAEGEVVVAATASGVNGGAQLSVVSPVPTTVALSPDTVRFTAFGQTLQLATEVRDQVGRVMAEATVSWSSGDTLVAVVDSAGLVTAVGGGTTTVTAAAGDVSDAVAVSVMQSAGSVVVSPAEATIALGDTLRLMAEAFDENGYAVDGAVFSWSASDARVATVDDSGLVTGVTEGTVRITATAGDASGVSEITVENPDRAALVALYNATDGPNWVDNTNWLSDAPLGEWYGVETDASGRVVSLDLGGRYEERSTILHGLRGPIPPELGNLGNLQTLNLLRNSLFGPVPPELGNLGNLQTLNLFDNRLSGPIPPELGNLGNLELLGLGTNHLLGPIPPELGDLGSLRILDLGSAGLSGPIPPQLGNLGNLWWLRIRDNSLTGPIPQSFLQLDALRVFLFERNEGLCVPGTSAFLSWLRAVEDRDDESETLCNAADVAALKLLYQSTDGTAWNESAGWSGDGAVEDWYGVTADSLGRVTILDLSHNALAGQLPRSLSELAHLTELRISGNAGLYGRLPLSLAQLSLRALHYSGTGLCAPVDAFFGDWLSAIPSHEGTGTECAPLSDREILETLYHATDGPNWTDNENWLTDAPLREWYGVWTDRNGRVLHLEVGWNGLTGAIPPELGSLTSLTSLSLAINALTGPIPPELGNLTKLRRLRLFFNQLSGPIPPELGNLASLGATPTWRQLPYRPNSARTGQPRQPDQAVSFRQPADRRHPARTGPARKPRIDSSLG